MNGYYVFSFVKRGLREATGLIGWRDHLTFVLKSEARYRRLDIKDRAPKEQADMVLRRVIKSERLA